MWNFLLLNYSFYKTKSYYIGIYILKNASLIFCLIINLLFFIIKLLFL